MEFLWGGDDIRTLIMAADTQILVTCTYVSVNICMLSAEAKV